MSLFQFFIWFYVAIWLNISLSACSCWLSVCLVLSVARPLEMMRNDCGGDGGGCIVEKIISLHWADKLAGRRWLGTSTLHWACSLHVIIWAGVHSFPRFCFRYYFVFYFAIKFTSIYMKFYGSFNFFCIKLHHLLKAPPLPSAACLVIWQMRPGTGTGNWWNWAQNGSRI